MPNPLLALLEHELEALAARLAPYIILELENRGRIPPPSTASAPKPEATP
jgi:hypothetical protein